MTNEDMEPSIKNLQVPTSFQFERVGFFVSDTHSIPSSSSSLAPNIVFNLTVGLRESKKKQALKK